MNVDFLKMPRQDAREKYLEYLRAIKVRQQHDKEKLDREHMQDLEALKATYRQLSLGNLVLDVNDAFRRTGTDHRGYPKIAIARPSMRWVKFTRGERIANFYSCDDPRDNLWQQQSKRNRVSVPASLLPGGDIFKNKAPAAMVPSVPARFIPSTGLASLHILFEPEWEVIAPRDPILLRRLGGPMFLVLAQWDLTEVERAVLYGSRALD